MSFELGDTKSALDCYQHRNEVFERLAADPTDAEAQRDLMFSYSSLAGVAVAALEYDIAVEQYTAAIAVIDRLIANGQNVKQSQQEREVVAILLSEVESNAARANAAIVDWDEFITQPAARSQLSLRITHLARTGRFDEIPQSAEMLRSLDSESPVNLYNAACGYALCAGGIQVLDGESLTDDQLTQRQEYIDLALACLRESIAAGWSDFDRMQQDPDLAVLRDLQEFEELMHSPPPPPLAE